jgi:hypothetical protein
MPQARFDRNDQLTTRARLMLLIRWGAAGGANEVLGKRGRHMRRVIILLIAAVIFKLALNEWNYRSAVEEALISVHTLRAAEACRNDAKARGFPPALPLTRPGDVRLVVGASELDVWLWDVRNPSWPKRYRTPYLRLPLQSGESILQCSFDVLRMTAVVNR